MYGAANHCVADVHKKGLEKSWCDISKTKEILRYFKSVEVEKNQLSFLNIFFLLVMSIWKKKIITCESEMKECFASL